tara:strand:+ start:3042 stop:5078 length:2037 start_codon:yes stop_codon:yes gene_type:complete
MFNQSVSKMLTQTNITKMLFVVAVCLLAPASMDLETISKESDADSMTEQMTHCEQDKRLMPQSMNHVSRHAFKRAVHRLELASRRKNLKGAILRTLLFKGKKDTAPLYLDDELSICPICQESECNTAPHFSNGLCADCNIDEGLLQMSGKPNNETVEVARSIAFTLAIVGLSALIAWIFMPKLLNSGLFGMSLMAKRQPTPTGLQAYKDAGFTVRKYSKPAPKTCKSCHIEIYKGEYMVMLPLYGKQNKPVCQSCAESEIMKTEYIGSEPIPTPPKTQPVEPVSPVATMTKKISIDLEPTAPKVQEKDALKAIRDIVGGGVDEDLVRQIATKVSLEQWNLNSEALAQVIGEQMSAHSAQFEAIKKGIDEKLNSIGKPTILHVKSGSKPALKIKGIVHEKMSELMWRIVRSGAMNNLYLHGDAGTGKTRICEQLFNALIGAGYWKSHGLKKPSEAKNMFILSCNKDLQSQELIGRESPRFFDDGSGRPAGEWDYIKGAIAPVFENGGLIVLDEIDRLHPSTLSALNAVLANGFFYTPKGEKILRHSSTVFVGTANTMGQGSDPKYNAANTQDSATLDRFAGQFVKIDYSKAIENAVAGSVAFADKFREVRRLANEHEISRVVISYRAIASAAEHVAAGASEDWALRNLCVQWGEENAMKMGYGEEIELDFTDENMWGAV